MELHLPKEVPSLPSWADVLEAAGLRTRQTTSFDVVSGMSLFAAGLLVGAGLGLLFAPSSGERLRHDLSERIAELRERLEAGLAASEGEEPEPARQGRYA